MFFAGTEQESRTNANGWNEVLFHIIASFSISIFPSLKATAVDKFTGLQIKLFKKSLQFIIIESVLFVKEDTGEVRLSYDR